MKQFNLLPIIGSLLVVLLFVGVQPVDARTQHAIVDCDAKYFNSREKDPMKNGLDPKQKIKWTIFADTPDTKVTFTFASGSPFSSNVPHTFDVTIDGKGDKEKTVMSSGSNGTFKYSITCTLPDGTEQWKLDPIIEVPRQTLVPPTESK